MQRKDPWTIEDLAEAVAATGRYAGGGAAAAMSLAGAAATLELVMRLSSRRKSLDDQDRQRLINAADLAHSMRADFLVAIDRDIDALATLMDAQRSLRSARKSGNEQETKKATSAAQNATQQAIAVPLEVARQGIELLEQLIDCQNLAIPFTMSDLGASAAMIQGAVRSLLLMAEVNLSILEDRAVSENAAAEIDFAFDRVTELGDSALTVTRESIR